MHETRFAFGKNWQSFRAGALDDDRVLRARRSLVELIGPVAGRTFLDVGSGSGLMSLAALREGAARVTSFDADPDSVACTAALRDAAAPEERARWEVLAGSVLDEAFVRSLDPHDVVYAWGVLHHTGDLWRALEHALVPARELLAIAIYNRVPSSPAWRSIKRAYSAGGRVRRGAMLGAYLAWRASVALAARRSLLREVREYRSARGMSYLHDAVDWLGGYPYEFASAEEVEAFVVARGFRPTKVLRAGGWGNNELVFRRAGPQRSSAT
jgi:SAM-dependent methyltransferase